MVRPPRATIAALACCALFIALGAWFIPYVGIQNDEALFAEGIYAPLRPEHSISIFKHRVPTMIMTYIGALKAWLYTPIFGIWAPSVYSVRVPVLLLGAISVWLLFRFAKRTAGERAAVAAAALLATDVTYVLTTTFDWGPVAIQHVLLLGGALALLRFHVTNHWRDLALGCFALGLGMWDKALFAWTLAGLAAAAFATVPREVLRRITLRNAAIAALAFTLGAAPLIKYNFSRRFATFSGNARFSTENLRNKVAVLEACVRGTSLFGYLVPDRFDKGEPRTALERASVTASHCAAGRQAGLGFYAPLAALVLLPLARRGRRAALFAIVFCAVTWVQMAFVQDAGGGAHHIVLFWPFPQLLIAAVFAGASERLGRPGTALLIVAIAILCAANVLILNDHMAYLIRGGTTPIWTDAIFPLADALAAERGRKIYVLDWGMFDSLRLLGQGRLDLEIGSDPFMNPAMSDVEQRIAAHMFADPDALFVAHTADKTVFTDVPARFEAALKAAGYRKEQVRTVADRLGRPVFEMFRLAAAAPAS